MNNGLRLYPWLGTVLTAVTLATVVFFSDYVGRSLSITFIFVVLSVYLGGLWWGLFSAGLVILAEVFLLFPMGQYGRFATVTVTLLVTVWLVSILQRKAVMYDTVNGNIEHLLKIMTSLQDTLEDWDRYTRDEIYERVKRNADGVVNLTTKVKGWHDIRLEMEEVNRAVNGEPKP